MKTPVISMNQMLAHVTLLTARYVGNNPSAYIKEAVMEDCPAGRKTFNAYFLLERRHSRDRYEVSFDVDGTDTAVLKCVNYTGRQKNPVFMMQKEFHVIFPAGRKGCPCFVPKHCYWDGIKNGTDLYYEQAKKKQKERLEEKRKKGQELILLLQQIGNPQRCLIPLLEEYYD